jgi:aminoglycoside phosphotransferase (APT) family kinase protein
LTTRENATDLLRRHFPALEFRVARIIEDGWDSLVVELDDQWILRFPRTRDVEESVEREIRLLPILARTLPVALPRFELVARNGLVCVGYRKLGGLPASSGVGERGGADIGRFLAALHRFPVERARRLGVPFFDSPAWRDRFAALCDEFRRHVHPLVRAVERERSEAVFARVQELDFDPVLIHGDLGPEHILCQDGRLVGAIDWTDAQVGDPALDLAWCLNGASPDVAEAVARTYAVDAELRTRSLFYHLLGPWHEALHGLETGQSQLVASGLKGIRSRLPTAP